ncbi:MAG: arylsulfatase [Rhodobacterales bacterium]|nr:arylsulfatase [Rhodobacterales bacterium]
MRHDRLRMVGRIIGLSAGLAGSAAMADMTSFDRTVTLNDHQQPAIPRPDQDATAAAELAAFEARTDQKPNIVILLIDDMGWGDPGSYGGGEAIGAATPNMDRLAAEGLRLTSTYAQQTCTPTRSAMLTGRLPIRTGLTRPILVGDRITANPWADETSLPAILGEVGYNTLLVGKWHIGEIEGMRPHEVGFDEFYGFYGAQKEITQEFDANRYPDLVLDPYMLGAYEELGNDINLIHGFSDGRTEVAIPTLGIEDMAEADLRLRDFTLQKIAELSQDDAPFFIEHAFMKVHTDNYPSAEFTGASASGFPYKDSLVEVDSIIGDIVDALDKAGELENTFIFVTSDNGPQMDMWPDSGFTPFHGAKGTTWEGGVRVPGIAYWPGMIAPGQVSDGLFDLMDLFNTSLSLAGALDKLPQDRFMDGVDQTSFLLADNGESLREHVYFWMNTTFMALRMHEYKIHQHVVMNEGSPFLWIDMATVQDVGTAPWLFNLYINPKEDYTVGHRMSPWLATMGAEMREHGATFARFPPKNIGL